MVLLELMWTFIKIGFASFGGMAMVPLINEEMISHGWMNLQEVVDIVAIAEMTPGSLGLNCATFVGIRVAGVWGAIAANLGVLTPTLTLCFAAAAFIERFKGNHYIESALYGVRPASLGMLLATALLLAGENYLSAHFVLWPSLVIGGLAALLLWKFKWSVPRVICISAVMGLLLVR